jgi:hypothetical protein
MFVFGFKIGDSHGYEDGYKAGYIYDCKDEVKSLREAHEDLKKAVDFSKRKAEEVQYENARLKYSREHYEDSLKNVERVKFLRDSIDKHDSKKGRGIYVDPYTGRVQKGVLRALEDEGAEK